MNRKNKISKNYLDLVPMKNRHISYIDDDADKIALKIENTGVFNWLAQKILHKPKNTFIHLDEYGTFVWLAIDDKTTVYQIGCKLAEKYGEKAEPVYLRLVQYFYTIESYGFVKMSDLREKN